MYKIRQNETMNWNVTYITASKMRSDTDLPYKYDMKLPLVLLFHCTMLPLPIMISMVT